jgi:hypothetical protein
MQEAGAQRTTRGEVDLILRGRVAQLSVQGAILHLADSLTALAEDLIFLDPFQATKELR